MERAVVKGASSSEAHPDLCAVACNSYYPSVVYWKVYAGSWIFYAYPGEHFFFDQPKVADFLWSYRKGWFIYTPLMLSAIAGFFFLKNGRRMVSCCTADLDRFGICIIKLVDLVVWRWIWYARIDSILCISAFAIGSFYMYIAQMAWRKWVTSAVVTCLIVLICFKLTSIKLHTSIGIA